MNLFIHFVISLFALCSYMSTHIQGNADFELESMLFSAASTTFLSQFECATGAVYTSQLIGTNRIRKCYAFLSEFYAYVARLESGQSKIKSLILLMVSEKKRLKNCFLLK